MGFRIDRHVLPIIVGFTPAALVLLTWDDGMRLTGFGWVFRWLSIPVLIVELFVILIALRQGLLAAIRRAGLPRYAVAASLLLLAIAVATATLVALDHLIAWILTTVWVLHALYALAIWHLCNRLFDRESFITASLAGFAAFALLLLVFVARIPPGTQFDWVADLPAVANVRHIGFYAGAIVGLCMGRFATHRSSSAWAATLTVLTLAFMLPLWNGSRGAFTATGGALLVGLALFPALRRWQVVAGVGCSVVLAAVLVSALPIPNELWGPQRMAAAVMGGEISSDRNSLWRATAQAIAERPFFGFGEGQVSPVLSRLERHPHNIVLQLLFAWGIVGTACIVVLVIPLARRVIRNVRAGDGEGLALSMAILVLAAYSLHDGSLFFPLPLSLVMAYVGLVVGGTAQEADRPDVLRGLSVSRDRAASVAPLPARA